MDLVQVPFESISIHHLGHRCSISKGPTRNQLQRSMKHFQLYRLRPKIATEKNEFIPNRSENKEEEEKSIKQFSVFTLIRPRCARALAFNSSSFELAGANFKPLSISSTVKDFEYQ